MRLNILSDLHGMSLSYNRKQLLQFASQFSLDQLEYSDVLVIAGDIGNTGMDTYSILGKIAMQKDKKYKDLVFVLGNHDYYCSDSPVLADSEFVSVQKIGDVIFLKMTMWSPIYIYKEVIQSCINDYRLINRFTIEENNAIFIKSMKSLIRYLKLYKDSDKKIVVVSHHVPTKELQSDEYKNSDLNEAFVVMHPFLEYDSIPDMISKIGCHNLKLWIHGHSHSFMDKTINGVRYIRNPVGYQNEMSDFKNNFIVEI